MISKQRHAFNEPVVNAEQLATLKQLDRILSIRKNRKEKHEAKTRELRRILEERKSLLNNQVQKAREFEQSSKQAIVDLEAANMNRSMSINDVLHWSRKEESIKKEIQQCYARCDELQDNIDTAKFKLDTHLKVYKQAVIDYEKIVIIKREIETQLEETS